MLFHKVDPAGEEWTMRVLCRLSDGKIVERSDIVYVIDGRKIQSYQTKKLTTAELDFIGRWEDEVFTWLAADLGITILKDCVERPRWEQVWLGAVYRPGKISELFRNPEDREDPWLWDDRPDWEDTVEREAKLGRERMARKQAMEEAKARKRAEGYKDLTRTLKRARKPV
jgi:hypothetical protein